jgi:succinylglutamic semialdehyde dehydrogenase
MPAAWDADPQPFFGGLISEQAAQHVWQAWQEHVERGGKTLLEPHLLQAGTSLLSPGIVEMSDAQNVPDEEVLVRYSVSGAMTTLMKPSRWQTIPVTGWPVG